MRAAVERIDRLDAALAEIVPAWTMAPVVAAFQAMRGVGFLTAAAVVAEAGDLRRFEHPRQLMAFLGLVPSERSTGDTRRQGGITKQRVREIAWKAQSRLCARYRRLTAKGKRNTVAITAIAREIAAFLWAIAREVEPASVIPQRT